MRGWSWLAVVAYGLTFLAATLNAITEDWPAATFYAVFCLVIERLENGRKER